MRKTITLAVATAVLIGTAVPALAEGTNDNFADALLISSVPFTDARSTVGTTRESYEPRPCGSIGSTVWYRYVATDARQLVADTRGSDFDTVLAVYSGTSPFGLSWVACNDDSIGAQSSATFHTTAGRTYYFQVGGYYSQTGSLVFNLDVPGLISGEVVNDAGDPVADVCVDVYDLARRRVASGSSDTLGDYVIDGLASGDYKVRFTDCGESADSGFAVYATEWYRNKGTFSSADVVTVTQGETITGIDATLGLRPRPDVAIKDVTIEDEKIRTAAGDAPASTGTARVVTVTLTNEGNARPRWTRLTVEVCPRSIGSCKTIGDVNVDLPVGTTLGKQFHWNATEMAGDVTLTALANTPDDGDWNDNTVEVASFVHVGGTGFGAGLECERVWVYPVYRDVCLN